MLPATAENIFEESEVEPNTVPAEALAGFEDLHRSRFLPHRIALAGIILLWILVPVLFIKSSCEISAGVMNDQNLPVYTVSVTTKLPVNKVTASLDGEPLQVYTKDSRTYAVNPDHNGTMEVKVTAANRQTSVSEVAVKEVDDQSPVLTESRIEQTCDGLFVPLYDLRVAHFTLLAARFYGYFHYLFFHLFLLDAI